MKGSTIVLETFNIKERKKDNKSEGKSININKIFHPSWKIDRDWLAYENGLMYCSSCRSNADSQTKLTGCSTESQKTFMKGTSNLKLDAIKTYELSKSFSESKKHSTACK